MGNDARPGPSPDAAIAAEDAGDHARASRLFEEACDFAAAGREALRAGDPGRSVALAALGGDEATARSAIASLVASRPRGEALRVASELGGRGFHRHAGELLAALGELEGAAAAFVSASEPCRAADCFERAGRPADAARALEAGLRARPGDARARLQLGRLLARHGRVEAAVKTLQRLDDAAPERALALPLLARSLASLGLADAARDVRDEMERLGVACAGQEAAPESVGASPAAHALLFGRYEAIREVSASPHARLVEAVDRVTAERVAVKIFSGSLEGAGRDAFVRFQREATALGQLRHPNVVPLREYVAEGPALVLAWMPGGSLADRLRETSLAPARAAEIACAVLAAIGEAHRLGILHRDIKPANVLFDDAGVARLSDFGAAHLGDLSRTATAAAIGTLAYMSPEQRMGRAATVASDVYGVGAIFAEMLTGEPGVAGGGMRVDRLPSARHPDLGAAHDAIVAQLLAADPKDRPADAFEARRAIASLHWPTQIGPARAGVVAAPRVSERPPSVRGGARAHAASEPRVRGRAALQHDTWLDRDVWVLPLDEAQLACARAFARAGHPCLPSVLRVDAERGEIWIAAETGTLLVDPVPPASLARLREAVLSLHAAGGAHGSIDADHLLAREGDVLLAYPIDLPDEGAADRDREALARLASRGP